MVPNSRTPSERKSTGPGAPSGVSITSKWRRAGSKVSLDSVMPASAAPGGGDLRIVGEEAAVIGRNAPFCIAHGDRLP